MSKRDSTKNGKSRRAHRPNRKAPRGSNGSANPNGRGPQEKISAPLTGDELNRRVAQVICDLFRDNPVRKRLREATGADDDAIDASLLTEFVQQRVSTVVVAFVCEQTADLLRLVYRQAHRERPTALKLIADNTSLAEKLHAAAKAPALRGAELNPFEQKVVSGVVEILRGMATENSAHLAAAPPDFPAENFSGGRHDHID